MEKDSKGIRSDVPTHYDWITRLAAETDPLKGYSKDTKEAIKSVMEKVDKGVDPQIAFKEAIEAADLTGMEMDKMEKRTDIAAILYDLYEIDVNPVNIDKTPTEHPD